MRKTSFTRPKQVPGDAYVTEAQKLLKLTRAICLALPKKWKDYLLDPLFKQALRIRDDTVSANDQLLNEEYLTHEQMINNLSKRCDYLDDAMDAFKNFDIAFDDLMGELDMLDTDFRYMYAKICEAVEKANPEKKLDIEIHGSDRFFSYTADADGEKIEIHLTRKKKDELLAQEALAKERIGDRRSKDQKWLRSLTKSQDRKPAAGAAVPAT